MTGMPSRDRLRPEIQALRALAVGLVVVFHLWPGATPGGFVGVDVFFVISGFLITDQLLREANRDGRISLPKFWARRARRLLPAALTVLLFALLGTLLVVPSAHWDQFLTEILASALYVENWQLASDAVDYLASENSPSPVQHYWSLAAEEQFYVLWPLLVGGGMIAAMKRPVRDRMRVIGLVLVAATAISLLWSILATAADPAPAYFITPTRAWEFGAGGLLAAYGSPLRLPEAVKSLLFGLGTGAILLAAFAYGESTPFPGTAALLPVLGAVAIIAAGEPAGTRAVRIPAIQELGRISYSVYLWHWPLIIFAPHVGLSDGFGTDVLLLALTLGAAWLTTEYIEDPVRRSALLNRRPPRLTFVAAAAGMALVVIPVAGAARHADSEVQDALRESREILADQPRCLGAESRDPDDPCTNAELADQITPEPIAAKEEPNAKCDGIERQGTISVCAFGEKRATRTVALLGDSHAAHWRGALEKVAATRRWRGYSMTRTSCPFSQAGRPLSRKARSRCLQWNDQLPAWFARHPEVDTVFVAQNSGGEVDTPGGLSAEEAEVRGYREAWRSLPPSVKRIVVLRDTPKVRNKTMDCVQEAMDDDEDAAEECAVPRSRAVQPDPAETAAQGDPRATVVDLNHAICTSDECLPVVGGVLVFKDEHHLTRTFSETLAPQLYRAVRPLLR